MLDEIMALVTSAILIMSMVATLLFLSYGLVWVPASISAHSKCLKNGWASYSVTWDLKAYCIRYSTDGRQSEVRRLGEIVAGSSHE